MIPGRRQAAHRPAKLVGFARREAGRDDRQLHRLLLKQRHAERLVQHGLDFRRWDTATGSSPLRRRR